MPVSGPWLDRGAPDFLVLVLVLVLVVLVLVVLLVTLCALAHSEARPPRLRRRLPILFCRDLPFWAFPFSNRNRCRRQRDQQRVGHVPS